MFAQEQDITKHNFPYELSSLASIYRSAYGRQILN